MSSRELPLRLAVAACCVLIPVALGWVPFLRYAWGTNLWQYLPAVAAWTSAALVVLLCLPAPRTALLRALSGASDALAGRAWLAIVALTTLFWLLRERSFFGDSGILMYSAASGVRFRFPDVGATYLFHVSRSAGETLGASDLALLQGLVCLCGALAVACFAGLGRLLAPDRERAWLFAAFVLCGGVLRVCFGHVEVYAFVLLAAGGYLWAACAFLAGQKSVAWPALALGAGIWVHPSFLFLAPSLAAAVWLAARERRGTQLVVAGALSALPLSLFLVAMLATGARDEVEAAWLAALRIAGLRPSPEIEHYFVRAPGAGGAGTEFALLSWSQLKYLANSFFVLAPAALPVLVGFAAADRRRFVATAEARFLGIAAAGVVAYSLMLRPIWGPYDWDLFSLTAVVVASLAGLLLIRSLEGERLSHLAAVLIGATLLFVTLPLIAIGVAPANDAGPFARQLEREPGESGWEALRRQIEPWL